MGSFHLGMSDPDDRPLRSQADHIRPSHHVRSNGRDLSCENIEVLEIGEVEDLKVDPVDTGVDPTLERRRRLVDRPGGTVAAEFVGFAPDRRGPSRDAGLVDRRAHHHCRRPHHRGRIAVDALAGRDHTVALLDERLDGREREVELRCVLCGQCRRPLRSLATHDDRRAARWAGFGSAGESATA